MTVQRLTIDNTTFSLNAFIANPNAYLPIVQRHVRASAFIQKESENIERYVTRLFKSLLNHFNSIPSTDTTQAVRTSVTLDEKCNDILSAMGIDIVKKCPKRSSILFKNSGNKYRVSNDELNKLVNKYNNSKSFCVESEIDTSNISIGVELEFIGKCNQYSTFISEMINLVGKKRFIDAGCYTKNDGNAWILGKDCSVKPKGHQCGCGMRGYEITSPILHLDKKEDFIELMNVCNLIVNVFKGEVNATCGTHVHMSFPVEKATDDLVKHFARSYKRSETTLFDKVVPDRRRENHAYYSRSINMSHVWDRYRKLNFNNVKKDSDNMHLEFRQLDGTLDFDKIYSWIKLQKLFVDMTMNTWKKECNDLDKPVKIELEDVILYDATYDNGVVENLMKMSKMIA